MHWDGTAWTMVTSPYLGASNNALNGVAAITSTDVWAVGFYFPNNVAQTLILHWDGASWSRIPSPNVGSGHNSLSGVAAHASNDVWAVGDYNYPAARPLILHWDGTAWASVPGPTLTSYSVLSGITALSPTNVWAVGYSDSGAHNYHTLIMHWDGSEWSVMPSPNPGVDENSLAGISAVTPDDIWAVGTYGRQVGPLYTLLLHWNGSQWESFPSTTIGRLHGVTMTASDDGWAVGNTGYTLILHWDGVTWRTVFSPNPGHFPYTLAAVQAVTNRDIWTVGSSDRLSESALTLTEHYTGRCVTATPTVPVSSATVTPSPSATHLLPSATSIPSPSQTAGPSICPAWQTVPSPNVGASSSLVGVGARTSSDIWAVGQALNGSVNATLTLHWAGSQWNIIASPNQGANHNYLYSVAPLAANDVWAVGAYYTGNLMQTLSLHWDGTTWTIVPTPNVGTGYNELKGVTARASNDVWAVGSYSVGTSHYTLVEHWDGTQWTVVPSPNPNTESSELNKVVALAANDIWAVGKYFSTNASRTLTEHWDGTQWSVIPSPNLGTGDNFLYSVAAVAGAEVWAVGFYHTGSIYQTLILHWSNNTWSIVPSPNASQGSSWLFDVSGVTANDVWAAGWSPNGGLDQTLTLHWNGAMWSVVPSPNASAGDNDLKGLVALSGGDVWAVGYSRTGVNQTLTLRWDTSCVTPTRTPGVTETATVSPTPVSTPCPVEFNDVPPGSTFYDYIRCLACRGIVGGYPCGGPGEPCPGAYFRPNNNVTRGQVSKITSESAGFSDPVPSTQQTFEDVPPSGTFALWVERLATRGIIAGYPCGGPFEPCVAPTNRPYFRPNNNVTRGQLSKITSGAAGWTETPTGQTFADVLPTGTFYRWVERLAGRGIIGGYPCGGPGEPCLAPANRPYFRPNNPATRGQMSKIAANAFFPDCQTPAR